MRFFGGIVAALLLAAPASAQESEPQEGAFEPAFTAEEDLDCAIFVAALMAELGPEMTPDNRIGLTSAITYLVGRFEAQRGTDLSQAFVERYPAFQERDPREIEQTCSIRMRAFSNRLQASQNASARVLAAPAQAADADAATPEEGQ